ncbi:hypothetical protein [Staphylococcus delphini]|uniref:Lipoprotein n=1 Tax=Staphylococcus delphini TaxID=53344 RepID=A0AAX0QUC0_9STAP|nr:hypothetical protein [Staphylococcus delphini]PCF50191.1 hypothetical protein B5C07_08260 [Staphylococcus delphini]PNZ95962.1 hypothetical protein CD148_02200 [Staphylococcus delphini]RIZ56178.1 hypothetical protein CDL68_01165 [Staphylococcus delphini]VED62402.1 Uncharacterised protein [Staphylococcus delphini]
MKKLLLTLTVLFIGIVLSACTDSEIKKLNGKWEGYDGETQAIITVKNGEGKILENDGSSSNIDSKAQPHKFKITKEGEQLLAIDEEGDKVDIQLVGDKLIIGDIPFTKVE